MSPGRALGVDLGERRIGLALSDPDRHIASPLSVVQCGKDRAVAFRTVVAEAREWEATTIVVGLPRSLSGKEGPAARKARDEAATIAGLAGDEIVVVLHDERLTTIEAERALAEGGVKRRDQKAVVDKVAAAVMLQSWLDTEAARG